MEISRQFLSEAARLVIRRGAVDLELLQKHFDLNGPETGQLLKRLEESSIIGPAENDGSRTLLCRNETFVEWYFGLPRERELLYKAAEVILRFRMATVSLIVSCLSLNYFQAEYLMGELDRLGFLGPYISKGIREVHQPDEETLAASLGLRAA